MSTKQYHQHIRVIYSFTGGEVKNPKLLSTYSIGSGCGDSLEVEEVALVPAIRSRITADSDCIVTVDVRATIVGDTTTISILNVATRLFGKRKTVGLPKVPRSVSTSTVVCSKSKADAMIKKHFNNMGAF